MSENRKWISLAILMALQLALSSLYIPLGDNLLISFTFLISMIIAIIFDFKTIVIYAISEDIIAYFLFPNGPFFFGYTLSALAGFIIYYFFLHNQKITYFRILLCKLCVNLLVNVGLNSLWSYLLYNKAFIYYVLRSLVKNIILCPIEALLFYLLYKSISPLLKKWLVKE